jgi:hypothetical protein
LKETRKHNKTNENSDGIADDIRDLEDSEDLNNLALSWLHTGAGPGGGRLGWRVAEQGAGAGQRCPDRSRTMFVQAVHLIARSLHLLHKVVTNAIKNSSTVLDGARFTRGFNSRSSHATMELDSQLARLCYSVPPGSGKNSDSIAIFSPLSPTS